MFKLFVKEPQKNRNLSLKIKTRAVMIARQGVDRFGTWGDGRPDVIITKFSEEYNSPSVGTYNYQGLFL